MKLQKLTIALLIFSSALITRNLYSADMRPLMYSARQPMWANTLYHYERDALQILNGERGWLLPHKIKRTDTFILGYPPGYGIFLSLVYRLAGANYFAVQRAQAIGDSLTAIVTFLIAAQLFGLRIGAISGFIVALAPHFAYHSNWIMPDSLCVLPIVGAIYLLLRAQTEPGYWRYCLAGLLVGLSCWLRPNALLLSAFLALYILLLQKRGWLISGQRSERLTDKSAESLPLKQHRPRKSIYAALCLVLSSWIAIAPITIRNYAIFHRFIPISLGAGVNLWEGIGEYSAEFGAVFGDLALMASEAREYNNPQYAGSLYYPDGIEREQERIGKSLRVIAEHPIWYLGVMVNRMGTMLKFYAYPMIDRDLVGVESVQPGIEFYTNLFGAWGAVQYYLDWGRPLDLLRPVARLCQRIIKEGAIALVILGTLVLSLRDYRKLLFILAVPLYYLLAQSTMHTEFRYALPMHCFTFILIAAGFSALIDTITWALRQAGIVTAIGQRHRRTASGNYS